MVWPVVAGFIAFTYTAGIRSGITIIALRIGLLAIQESSYYIDCGSHCPGPTVATGPFRRPEKNGKFVSHKCMGKPESEPGRL